MTYVQLERRDAVAIVTLDRPDRLNAISGALLADLHGALSDANADPEVGAIVLTGAGRAFCAGDDRKEFADQANDPRAHIEAIQQITRDLMLNGKPVVGALHGYAVGGGFEWLLNCDLVVAADDLVAFFPGHGENVTGAVTHLLPLAVGHQRAMELLLLGERQSAADLKALGLVNRVVPRAEVVEAAVAWATAITQKNGWSVRRLKRMVNEELQQQLLRALELETEATVEAFRRPEARAAAQQFGERS